MSYSSKKARVVSLKEAADINKKDVAYFTLTDGSVVVIKKDENNESESNNTQKEGFSRYKRKYYNNYNQSSKNEEVYKVKKEEIEQNSEKTPSKGYSFKGEVYENKESSFRKRNLEGKNENTSESFKGQIYEIQSGQESNKEDKKSYKINYQKEQNENNENNSKTKGYSYKNNIYGNNEIYENEESYKDKKNGRFGGYKRRFQSERNNDNNNVNDSSSKGYFDKEQIYSNINTNENKNNNSNVNENDNSFKNFQFRKYSKQNQNNKKNNEEIKGVQGIQENDSKNESQKLRSGKDSYENTKSQYSNNNQYNQYHTKKENQNNYDNNSKLNKNINYKIQIIEAIPVKLANNYNSQLRNYSHPKPQYVQPYINPELNISQIKYVQNQNGNFGNQSNIDFPRGYNTNFNKYSRQITDSFHDFDNLQEYEEQRDFRDDPYYRNVELKYSQLSAESGNGIYKSYNSQVKKYERPFTNVNVEIKNSYNSNGNSLLKQTNSQINNHNLKISSSSGNNIGMYNKY